MLNRLNYNAIKMKWNNNVRNEDNQRYLTWVIYCHTDQQDQVEHLLGKSLCTVM